MQSNRIEHSRRTASSAVVSPSRARQTRGVRAMFSRAIVLATSVLIATVAPAAELVAPYVQTVMEDVELMLELAEVGPGDYLIDLGSGDGRIVINAAQRGAIAHGVELDGQLVEFAGARARDAGVDDRAGFVQGDVFAAELGAATVVTMYLMPEVNLRLRPRLLTELAPGTRVLSNSFDLGDWQPDQHVFGRTSGGIFLWIVPARLEGRWRATLADAELDLVMAQRFQEVDVRTADGAAATGVHVRGDRISFLLEDGRRRYAFSGHVTGDLIEGLVHVHADEGMRVSPWQARRVGAAMSGDESAYGAGR